MAFLEVISGPDEGRRVDLKAEPILLGRDFEKCHMVLNDEKVSRIHLKVTLLSGGNLEIEDCGSSNGTFLRGKQIENKTSVFAGDLIFIGNDQIKFVVEPDGAIPVTGTVPLRNGEYQPIGGHTRELHVQQSVINIGRDESNDIVLNHPMVSRFHARIVYNDGKHVIFDLDSMNGTYVDGVRVTKSMDLYPASLVQVGSYKYVFDGSSLFEYAETAGQVKMEMSNLNRTVKLSNGESRELLKNISLVIEPKDLVAVLGGSGSGKSTLLGALTGMRPATSGEIYINGRNFYKEMDSFRSMVGYVPQDDIVHNELTVEEVLTYSARLRMPDDTSPHEIQVRVEEVMNDLELITRRDVQVKKLSGGQRKRVSIGVELLTKPSLFFLDEPTSGLDPGLEKIMMELMRKLANQGHTIILVTHATFNIHLCDKVIFLTEGGQLAFFGTPSEALAYFGTDDFAEIYKKISTERTPDQWAKSYLSSLYYQKQIQRKMESKKNAAKLVNLDNSQQGYKGIKRSAVKQWWTLTQRYTSIITRDKKNLFILLLQPVIITALIVMAFLYSAPTYEKSKYTASELQISEDVIAQKNFDTVQDRIEKESRRRSDMSISIATLIFTIIWLGTSNSAREITKELPVYKRERLVNLGINPYLMSKVTVLSVISLIQSLLLVAIASLGLGLPNFWLSVSAFYLIALASMMMGLTVSASASNPDKAISTVPLLLVPQIILSGALVEIDKVKPEFFQSIFDLAISKWGFQLVAGGLTDINGRVPLEEPITALKGDFSGHWWVLAVFIIVLYIVASFAVWRKDSQVD